MNGMCSQSAYLLLPVIPPLINTVLHRRTHLYVGDSLVGLGVQEQDAFHHLHIQEMMSHVSGCGLPPSEPRPPP